MDQGKILQALADFLNDINGGKYKHVHLHPEIRIDISIEAHQQSISTLLEIGDGKRRASLIQGAPTIEEALKTGAFIETMLISYGYKEITYDRGEFVKVH